MPVDQFELNKVYHNLWCVVKSVFTEKFVT